jgi:hypothetical protein
MLTIRLAILGVQRMLLLTQITIRIAAIQIIMLMLEKALIITTQQRTLLQAEKLQRIIDLPHTTKTRTIFIADLDINRIMILHMAECITGLTHHGIADIKSVMLTE